MAHDKVHVICENLCLEEGMTKGQIYENFATQETVSALASGSPKGYYTNAAALKAANPETGVYIATGNGHIYAWTKNSTSDPVDLGLYQAAQLEDESVTDEKIKNVSIDKVNEVSNVYTENYLNKDNVRLGTYNINNGNFNPGKSTYQGNVYESYTSDFIECSSNQNFMKNWMNVGNEVTFWNENKNFVSGSQIYGKQITIPDNSSIKYFCVTIPVFSTNSSWSDRMRKLEEAMVVKGTSLPNKYIPYKKRYITDLKSSNELPRGVIFDTDWAYDVDDAVAARVLLACEKLRLIDIMAVTCSLPVDKSVPSLDAFFRYEGRPNLAIGISKVYSIGHYDTGNWHDNIITHPYSLETANAEDCVRTMRRCLDSAIQPIDIIVTGGLINVYSLLNSVSDDISELSGYEIVAKKVRKIWVMGGRYPSGSEANFTTQRGKQYASYVCSNCPVPLVFLGWEVSNTVLTGKNILDRADYDILAKALVDYGATDGRQSWDPMVTLLACLDDFDLAGYNTVYGTNSVNSETGANTFNVDINKKDCYVVKNHPDKWYENQINDLLERVILPSKKLGEQQIPRVIVS